MAPTTEADTIRILVATDNHVGYEERDPIRKDDSWRTFEEILTLARTQDVDMVLLGGDLFHDNKPSRKSMYQVMRALRKNCLGPKPCELEFLSDAHEVFEGAFNDVNYQDPDINVSIPVFSIHGNHDDPSGDGHFCSLDLLQVAGLVNYFGRVPEADNIQVRPVLLQKGKTKLALYGLSNVRDERMFRTFRDSRVKWFAPNLQRGDFFNLLTVHQNHHAHTATGYLPESMLPDFMDLVVWGHEHECLIDPRRNPETGFHVMQPGSSVATSLVPGEAVPKHVAILNITGKDFQIDKIPLKTVRPFVTDELVLSTDKRFKGVDKKKENRQEITKRLMDIVEEMIQKANDEWLSIQDEGDDVEEQPLPLIRLKVEYTAPEGGKYDVENPQRFSNRFVGKVANTNDVVYFYRKKTGQKRDKPIGDLPEGAAEAIESMDTIKVEALVQEFLAAQSLKVLPQAPFGDAVNQFVSKDDKHAMETFVSESLAGQVKNLLSLDPDEDNLDSAMERVRAKLDSQFAAGQLKIARRRKFKPKPDEWDSDLDGHWEDQPEALANPAEEEATATPTNGRARGRAARTINDDDDDDVSMLDAEEEEAPARKAPAKRGAAARATKAAPAKKAPAAKKPAARGRKKVIEDDEDEDENMFVEQDDEEEEEAPPKRAAPKRAQPARSTAKTAAKPAARQTKLNFSQSQKPAAGSTQQKALEISDDEISEDDDFETLPATRSRRR
ncbi:DNA repair exonuclease [Coniochaeta ligniaria NRRL 30616]|uniref:Double-strand break repair protein n=1 Tax=Coniochaeta ligniaria NRRL 30616 TaxID=1408157 RepID=A0A1J7I5Z4_9PEZI|nr:DNA repair exonuclease [Coniochaeta ligniaria NRRL 30616]